MSTKISEIEEDTEEELQEPVVWKDFLILASKVRQQEELIKTLNATSSGKLKQKIRHELRKRGITLVRKAS